MEGEKEGTSTEDLGKCLWNCTTDQVVRVLYVLEDVGVELMMVEQVLVQLRKTDLKVQILETFLFHLFILFELVWDEELESLPWEKVDILA